MTADDRWRLPAAYEAMLAYDASAWAWEFLRRNPRYRAEAGKAPTPKPPRRPSQGSRRTTPQGRGPPAWGLHFRAGPRPEARRGSRLLAA